MCLLLITIIIIISRAARAVQTQSDPSINDHSYAHTCRYCWEMLHTQRQQSHMLGFTVAPSSWREQSHSLSRQQNEVFPSLFSLILLQNTSTFPTSLNILPASLPLRSVYVIWVKDDISMVITVYCQESFRNMSVVSWHIPTKRLKNDALSGRDAKSLWMDIWEVMLQLLVWVGYFLNVICYSYLSNMFIRNAIFGLLSFSFGLLSP